MSRRILVVVLLIGAFSAGLFAGQSGLVAIQVDDSAFDVDVNPEVVTGDSPGANDNREPRPVTTTARQTVDHPTGPTPSPTTVQSTPTERRLATDSARHGLNLTNLARLTHEFVNQERATHGLSTLSADDELAVIATYHSQNMAANGTIYHTSPSGQTVGDRYDRFGYDCRVPTGESSYLTGAENVLYTYYDERVITDSGTVVRYTTEEALARGMVTQWMNSPGHRANILEPAWNAEGLGFAVAETPEGLRVYATQNFC